MKFESGFSLALHNANELRSGSGSAVALSTKRTLLLLVILSEHAGQPLSRRRLASLVWPSSDDRAARDSLRNALSVLRKSLPVGALSADAEHVSLSEDVVRVATSSVDGEFMPDFDDDWVVERRLQDRAEAVELFLNQARSHVTIGDNDSALQLAERACARDPFCDEAAALRIELLEKQGKKTEASDVSHGHRTRMLRFLGAVSEVRRPEPESDSPLITMAEWLIERDPGEAVAFLASTGKHWEVSPPARAFDIHRRVLRAAGPEVRHRASVEAQTLYIQWCLGGLGPNRADVEASLQASMGFGDVTTSVRLATALSYSYLSAGQFRKALDTAKLLTTLAKMEGSPEALMTADMTLGILHEHAGDPALARAINRRVAAKADDAESLVDAAHRYLVRAHVALLDGKLAHCDEALQQSRSAFAASGGQRMLGFLVLLEAQLLDESGDTLAARRLISNVLELGGEVVGHSATAMATDLLAAIDCRLGEFSSAAERLAESESYRISLGTVASPMEQQRLAPVRRALVERLGPQHLARVRRASVAQPLA